MDQHSSGLIGDLTTVATATTATKAIDAIAAARRRAGGLTSGPSIGRKPRRAAGSTRTRAELARIMNP